MVKILVSSWIWQLLYFIICFCLKSLTYWHLHCGMFFSSEVADVSVKHRLSRAATLKKKVFGRSGRENNKSKKDAKAGISQTFVFLFALLHELFFVCLLCLFCCIVMQNLCGCCRCCIYSVICSCMNKLLVTAQ